LELCDIFDLECQRHLFDVTACMRGVEPGDLPMVEALTRDEYRARLEGEDPLTVDESREDAQFTALLQGIRLLPVGAESSRAATIDALVDNVLAFYSTETGGVTIIERDDVEPQAEVFVLSHEFVHVQQDRELDLQAFTGEHVSTFDDELVVRSMIEGEAMLYSNLVMAQRPGFELTLEQFSAYYANLQASSRKEAEDPFVPYQIAAGGFPYAYGGPWVTGAWGAHAESGVRSVFDDLPPSARALMAAPSGDPGAGPAVSLGDPALPDGYTVLSRDTFGAWMLYMFVARNALFGEDEAYEAALVWEGDAMLIAAGSDPDDAAMLWRVRFQDGSAGLVERIVGALQDRSAPGDAAWRATVTDVGFDLVLATRAADLATWTQVFDAVASAPTRPLDYTDPTTRRRLPRPWPPDLLRSGTRPVAGADILLRR
jgi:hypothetical protein